MLPSCQGKLARFYDRFLGNSVVFYFCDFSNQAATKKVLQKFIQLCDEFYSNNRRVVMVTHDSYKLNAKFDKENGYDLDILSDPSGAITNGYCGLRGKVSKSVEPSTKTIKIISTIALI